MAFRKEGYVFLASVVVLASAVSAFSFLSGSTNPQALSVRLLALNGFLFLSVATILTPFLQQVKNAFNKPFLTIHHTFAAVGLTLITLHPLAIAFLSLSPAVFLPNLGSLELFFTHAGRPALIIIYVAFAAALLRRRIMAYWRGFHALMYVALFFGVVHANLLGTDFQSVAIRVVFSGLFAASIVVFALKRLEQHRIKMLRDRAKQKAVNSEAKQL